MWGLRIYTVAFRCACDGAVPDCSSPQTSSRSQDIRNNEVSRPYALVNGHVMLNAAMYVSIGVILY